MAAKAALDEDALYPETFQELRSLRIFVARYLFLESDLLISSFEVTESLPGIRKGSVFVKVTVVQKLGA